MRVLSYTLSAFLVASCNQTDENSHLEMEGRVLSTHDRAFVDVILTARGGRDLCIPASQLSSLYGSFEVLKESGTRVPPLMNANKWIYLYKGIDLADGVLVVSPEKAYSVIIPLENFELEKTSNSQVTFDIQYFDCIEMFDSDNPKSQRLQTTLS